MKKIDHNTLILIIAVLIFIGGAILMAASGDSLAGISPCCF